MLSIFIPLVTNLLIFCTRYFLSWVLLCMFVSTSNVDTKARSLIFWFDNIRSRMSRCLLIQVVFTLPIAASKNPYLASSKRYCNSVPTVWICVCSFFALNRGIPTGPEFSQVLLQKWPGTIKCPVTFWMLFKRLNDCLAIAILSDWYIFKASHLWEFEEQWNINNCQILDHVNACIILSSVSGYCM